MSKHTFVLAVSGLVLVLDQLTKMLIRATVPLHTAFPVIDSFFHITHVLNSGGAFSFLADASPTFRLPFFLAASAVAIGALIHFIRQVAPHQRLLLFALAGILGGAVGNLVDRVAVGQVTDFLDLHWRGYHWPAFNVADSFISVGVCILLLHSVFAGEPEEHQDPPGPGRSH